ncbi:hypothetical protein JAAARDRAFT_67021 [Jaapia argillacea MUCL 33604]|uniref:Uncharacterized protein n=1 Tax=Jaapia argillacea MUCL 33604 TaxID=933084 RepID=A0A067Q0U2_9AGAM|nr:hypothetical protein JAAARDRAFT_67021 [Jaapia argillacea MUCL 33604]
MSSSFSPTPAELALVQKIFALPEAQKLGALTGDVAVQIFGGSKLPPTTLGEIWALADSDNNGWLSKKGAAVAVRLMGWAQKGEKVREELINKPGPIPTIEGVSSGIEAQRTGTPTPKSPPPPSAPVLTPQDKTKFMRLFTGSGPVNGLLSGEKARDIFVKSKLPVEKLSQIWFLADTQNRGALDSTDFTIAMYLIQACMSGQLTLVPATLPPGLYEQAGGRAAERVTSHGTGSSGSFSPTLAGSFPGRQSAVQTHSTGQMRPQITGSQLKSSTTGPPLPSRPSPALIGSSAFGTALQPQGTGQHWDITATEKANADRFFDTLDPQMRGYIEGDVAVPFLLQSKLPEEALAQIWDLSDIHNDGRLTRDGFAIAMHLIQNKLAGKDVPTALPSSLIPPHMRTTATSAFAAPRSPPPAEPLRDLLWDETPPPSAASPHPPAPFQPQRTGTLSPQHTATPAGGFAHQVQDPFGGAFGSVPHRDLLGDDDDHPTTASPPLEDKSAEIGNTQNQLNSTNRSLENARTERNTLERTLADQAAQLSALQTQLSSAKAAYETESKLLITLRERFTTQSAEIQKSREELITAESDLSGLRVEKGEVQSSLLRDKDEVRELQRKMHEVGLQTETIKVELEKAKKEAKQQKGLLAIAKKQLVTKEHEKLRIEKELNEAEGEVTEVTKEKEEVEAELAKEEPTVNGHDASFPVADDNLFAAMAQPLPMSPEPGSPIASPTGGKSTNPFDRFMSPMASTPRSQSPFMPFAAASIPTPPSTVAPPAENVSDPFGLDTIASEEPHTTETATTDNTDDALEQSANPTFPPLSIPPPQPSVDTQSPSETDFWTTPPQTASANDIAKAAEAQFPAIDETTPTTLEPETHEDLGHEETDLATQLKEIDGDESDTSDEDEEPLAERRESLIQSKGKEPQPDISAPPSTLPAFDVAFGEAAESAPIQSVPAVSSIRSQSPALSSHSASKDIFSSPLLPHAAPPPSIPAHTTDTVIEPAPRSSSLREPSAVSDFDEAFGKLANSSSTGGPPDFSFDTGFDDDFDFAHATSGDFKPAASSGNGVAGPSDFDAAFAPPPKRANGHAAPAATTSTPLGPAFSFDDAFSTPATNLPPTAASTSAATPTPVQNGSHGIAFDDAFGGLDTSKALALDNSFGTDSSRGSTSSRPQVAVVPFPTPPPASPPHAPSSPETTVRRSGSPAPRSLSPPVRAPSPKLQPGLRPSTAGSGDKHKEARHSRLSIRLPFGKKKAKHDAAAPPIPARATTLSPLEEPSDSFTPAVDDDVEPVKQLCGMGFSRAQAVGALEKHGYDVQKALNSLLGTQ